MRSFGIAIFMAVVICSTFAESDSRAATAQQVQTAIDRATAYVYSQLKDDNWEIAPSRDPKIGPFFVRGAQWGGITALSTYALLAAGESPQDPRLAKAIEFLRTADLIGTYGVAVRSQVWLNIPKTDLIREAIAKDAKLLLASRRTTGVNKGEYTYLNNGPTGASDHSNSQYGVLGLWACSDAVEGIPDTFWTDVDTSWRHDQGSDGSWAYMERPGGEDRIGRHVIGSPTMTAAGVATLFITQDFLYRAKGLECSGNIVDSNIDSGMKWMAGNFQTVLQDAWPFYGLYGVERIGVASGYKYFGDVNWFQAGADFIIGAQNANDGSFSPAQPGNLESAGSLVNTCFALLFLSRGRAPVMMSKLQYETAGKTANWNQRPRDAFNIARWVGKQTENTLNWQIDSIKSSVKEWHDAPILYITGDQALAFTPEEKAKLKAFVEEGGLILGSADCGKPAFTASFCKLGSSLFESYEFEQVPANSVILHDEQYDSAKWRRKPRLLGLSNGARELMLLVPDADPPKAWQLQTSAGKEELFQLAANIYLYAVDKENMFLKGDTYIVEPNPAVTALKTIDVARLSYEGNWNPEPGGWRRLGAVMHNGDSIDVNASPIDPAKDSLEGKKIAHLTGTDSFRLSAPAIVALKRFINDGGTLIVDGAGGKSEFSASAEKILKAIFGADADQLKQPLPSDNPLYQAGGNLDEVTYRSFARAALGSLKGPRLRGIIRDNRLVCVFSPEDLSVGLVGEPVDGILGYSPETATALMRKILLAASGVEPVTPSVSTPAPQPPVKIPRATMPQTARRD